MAICSAAAAAFGASLVAVAAEAAPAAAVRVAGPGTMEGEAKKGTANQQRRKRRGRRQQQSLKQVQRGLHLYQGRR